MEDTTNVGHFQDGAFKSSFTSEEEALDYQRKAKQTVVLYYNRRQRLLLNGSELNENDVYIVWFSKTLQNWKAMASTKLPDGIYYELTYNGEKNELYLDAYKRLDNVIYTNNI